MNSNELKPIRYHDQMEQSFLRKRGIKPEPQNNSAIVKISTIESKDESKSFRGDEIRIKEIQEFQMPDER